MTGPLVAAIEATWAAIQSRHPDVPDVVLTLGNGSTRPGQLTLGHFHAGKWATRDTDAEAAARLPELFVGGEGLAAGPRDLLGTLLHEAAHGVAAAREVKDTSRQGRYHNTRYRELATELGITVERDPRIGWSLTTVPDGTAALYSEHITELGEAMRGAPARRHPRPRTRQHQQQRTGRHLRVRAAPQDPPVPHRLRHRPGDLRGVRDRLHQYRGPTIRTART